MPVKMLPLIIGKGVNEFEHMNKCLLLFLSETPFILFHCILRETCLIFLLGSMKTIFMFLISTLEFTDPLKT